MTFREATQLRRLHATGKYRQHDLADRFCITDSYASRVLANRFHHDPNYRLLRRYHPRHGKLSGLTDAEIRKARAEGHTLAEIGSWVGATRQAVADRLRRSTLPLNQ